jgi:hypothetical protein
MSFSSPPPNDALTAATELVKTGRLDQARETLMQYLVKNPSSEQAWLLMSYVLPDPAKQRDCLERVLKINPNNTVAQSKLAHLLGRRTEELFIRPEKPSTPPPREPDHEPEPEPEPSIEPEPGPSVEPEPVEALSPAPRPASAAKPAVFRIRSAPPPAPSKTLTPAEITGTPSGGSIFSGKGRRILLIGSAALIAIILVVLLYISVIGPMIRNLGSTPTPTTEPVAFPTYPPEWTRTPTPTETPIPPTPTPTFTPTETLVPSETTIP